MLLEPSYVCESHMMLTFTPSTDNSLDVFGKHELELREVGSISAQNTAKIRVLKCAGLNV